MALMALYSRHGKKRCAFGATAILTADAKVMADVVPLGITTPAPTTKVIVAGPPPVAHFAAAAAQPLAPSSAPGPAPASTATPLMRYGPAFSGNTNPNARRPGTFQVPPTPTP